MSGSNQLTYGEVTGGSGHLANEFDFAGQQTDGTGLQYLRARYYDTETGTFLSREPMATLSGWLGSPMGYARLNPVRNIDASGLVPIDSDGCNDGDAGCSSRADPVPQRGLIDVCSKSGCGRDYSWNYLGGISCDIGACIWDSWALTDGGSVLFGKCVSVGEYPTNCSAANNEPSETLADFIARCAADQRCSTYAGIELGAFSFFVGLPGGPWAIGGVLFTVESAWGLFSCELQSGRGTCIPKP